MDSTNYYKRYNDFKGKNVIITGGTGGIGILVVKRLLQLEANVYAFVRNGDILEKTFNEALNRRQLKFITIDFERVGLINSTFRQAMIELGGRLDILLICHGIFNVGNISNLETDKFDKVIKINTRSPLHLLSLSVPFLKLSQGNVVMISSLESKIIERDSFLNSVSKSMINALIESSALELAPFGIRVNAVAPGMTNTNLRLDYFKEEDNMNFLDQMGGFFLLNREVLDPNDIAEGIIFLASNEASFITGEIMVIDNGFALNHDLSFSDIDENSFDLQNK